MLRLAAKYGDIIYIAQFGESESYFEMKKIVMTAAKKAKRENKIAFMVGPLYTTDPYNSKDFIKHVESAKEAGASYFLTSIPRNAKFIDSVHSFAQEIIPSFR